MSTRPPWTDFDHQSGCPRPSRSGLHKYHKTYNVFFQFFKVVFDIFDDCIEIACSIIFRCESWKFVNQFVDCTRCIWNAVIHNNILLHFIFLKIRFESRLLLDPLASPGHFLIHLRFTDTLRKGSKRGMFQIKIGSIWQVDQ